jgi:transaldolase
MKLYLDTGMISEIEKAASSRILDGVTTNPSLIAKTGKDFKTTIKEILKIMKKDSPKDFTVSAEVIDTTSVESILKEGRVFAKLDKHILVKVPLTRVGLEAVTILSSEGIRCNVTLCFSANQALLAAKSGAWCVSPFLGRVDDEGYDGIQLIKEIRTVFDVYKFNTRILAASVRSTHHVHECAQLGCDMATMPLSVFEKLYYNPLTDIGLEKFQKDWENRKVGGKK